MSEPRLLLTGLDASNPLGFMAALGVLRLLSDETAAAEKHCYRLCWRDNGRWLAELEGCDDADLLVAKLHADLDSWADEAALNLSYDTNGELVSSLAPNGVFDLKPKPSAFRSFCARVANDATPDRLRSVRLAAAFGSEVVTDNNGNLKPTALHFTAGRQLFLDMVRQLRAQLSVADFHEALFGPWRNDSKLPSLSWNASASRVYAYRATDPSGEKRGSVPAADWLAFCGLSFFPVAPNGGWLLTTTIRGGWKDSSMTWPVWTSPLSAGVVRSLLTYLPHISRNELSRLGIAATYRASILRSDQGGYGTFSPASAI